MYVSFLSFNFLQNSFFKTFSINFDLCCSTAGSVELTVDESKEVEKILSPLGIDEEELENVYSVLRNAHCNSASIQMVGGVFLMKKCVVFQIFISLQSECVVPTVIK